MQKQKLNKRIVITGGGSGGHVSVATALISELEKRYEDLNENLLYIGGDLSMVGDIDGKSIEQRRMEGKPYKFVKIRAGKLQRVFSLSAISLLFRAVLGIFDAKKILSDYKPDLIISTGGFVTLPVAIAAYFQKIPLYIHEQTAAVGLTNNIAAKVAKKIFVTFQDSLQYFPKEKTTVVGNPVREEIFQENSGTELLKALENMKKYQKILPIIYISGGGLGSHIINIAVRDCLTHLLEKYQVVLQTGDNQTFKDYAVLEKDWKKLPKEKKERFFLTKFVSDFEIGSLFKNSDLVIGRAGANTVYELGVLGKPCILIPIPWVTHNEQEKNAKILEKIGLATIVREGEISRENFMNAIDRKFENMIDMKVLDSEQFPTDSAARIIDSLEILLK